jgi:type III secretory pathway component EscU
VFFLSPPKKVFKSQLFIFLLFQNFFFQGFDVISEILFDKCSAFIDFTIRDELGKSPFLYAVEQRMEDLITKMLKSNHFYQQIDINTEIVKFKKNYFF